MEIFNEEGQWDYLNSQIGKLIREQKINLDYTNYQHTSIILMLYMSKYQNKNIPIDYRTICVLLENEKINTILEYLKNNNIVDLPN